MMLQLLIRAFVIVLFLFGSAFANGTTIIWVCQTAAGSDDGTNASNCHSAAWFNTAGNWGGGTTDIDPGDTVMLSGSITTALTVQASGSVGNIITIDGTNATLSNTFTGTQTNYWTLTNFAFATGMTVIGVLADRADNIEVSNGTMTDTSGVVAKAIDCRGCSNALLTNNTFTNNTSGAVIRIQIGTGTYPHDVTVSNNTLTQAADSDNVNQRDVLVISDCYNITVTGNDLWQQVTGTDQHDDVVQIFGSTYKPRDITISNNRIVLNSDSISNKSWLMIEAMTNDLKIFNNVFDGIKGASSANGASITREYDANFTMYFYGNTLINRGSGPANMLDLPDSAPTGTYIFKNNIFYDASAGTTVIAGGVGVATHDYNSYYGGHATNGFLSQSCAAFKSANEVCAQDPLFQDYSNKDYRITTSSPVKDSGASLGAGYNTGISTAAYSFPSPTTTSRPQGSAWDIGAYEYVSGGGTGSSTLSLTGGTRTITPGGSRTITW